MPTHRYHASGRALLSNPHDELRPDFVLRALNLEAIPAGELGDRPVHAVPGIGRVRLEVIPGDQASGLDLRPQDLQLRDSCLVLMRRVEIDPVEVVIPKSGKDLEAVADMDL